MTQDTTPSCGSFFPFFFGLSKSWMTSIGVVFSVCDHPPRPFHAAVVCPLPPPASLAHCVGPLAQRVADPASIPEKKEVDADANRSAWNNAGTWEEMEKTDWCKGKLTEAFRYLLPLSFPSVLFISAFFALFLFYLLFASFYLFVSFLFLLLFALCFSYFWLVNDRPLSQKIPWSLSPLWQYLSIIVLVVSFSRPPSRLGVPAARYR